ncbi:MAG TPA: hypothetical protein VN283_11485 [Thiobacillus sp.]|nr:hypothetical protein [Thiobacillus sp.]
MRSLTQSIWQSLSAVEISQQSEKGLELMALIKRPAAKKAAPAKRPVAQKPAAKKAAPAKKAVAQKPAVKRAAPAKKYAAKKAGGTGGTGPRTKGH